MKNKIIVVLLTVSVIGLVQLASPSSTYACSCGGSPSAKEAMAGSDVTFMGKVISVVDDRNSSGTFTFLMQRSILFEVETVWKGEPKARYVVHTGRGGGDCGLSFSIGDKAVIYASAWDSLPLRTGLCSYVRPDRDTDDRALGPGIQVPAAPVTAEEIAQFEQAGHGPEMSGYVALLAFTITGLMLSFVVVWIKHRKQTT